MTKARAEGSLLLISITVRPLLEYGSVLWDPHTALTLQPLNESRGAF